MSDKFVKLDDILAFPIRHDHCDKEHADPAFINGIETVIEFIENLPVYEMTATKNKQNRLSFEERTFCLNYIQELLALKSNSLPHFRARFVNFDSYAASELRHKILENVSDALMQPGKNRQFIIKSGFNGLKGEINMFFFKSLMRVGDKVVLKLDEGPAQQGIIKSLDATTLTLERPMLDDSIRLGAEHVVSFEITEEATIPC